jgi:hypothetical protein
LEQDRGRDTVNGTLSLFPADVGGDEQLFRRLGRHSLIPCDHRDGEDFLQVFHEFQNRLRGRPDLAVQAQRQPDHHLPDIVFPDQPVNMLNVGLRHAPLVRLQRLSRPSQLIAERDADAFRSMIEG